MIPKIIHYCWFGKGTFSPLMVKCIETWKSVLPEYEFILWNEDNFDINSTAWTKHAYELKKYAFVSDYVRLKVLYQYGGIYLDTDVKMLRSFNSLLSKDGFMCFEDVKGNIVASCVMAAIPKHSFIEECLQYYDRDFTLDIIDNNEANVVDITRRLVDKGLQIGGQEQSVSGIHIFPREYFCPMDFWGNWKKTRNTYCVHLFSGSWLPDKNQKKLNRRKTWYFRFSKWIYVNTGLQRLKKMLTDEKSRS